MGGNPFILVIELDCMVVGLEDDMLTDQPGWSRIGVGIEGNTEILVNFKAFDLPAIGEMLRQKPQCPGVETCGRPFTGCSMDAHIGSFIPPLVGLVLQIVKVLRLSKGPEILLDVADTAPFDLSLFLGLTHMTGLGEDMKRPEKIQKRLVVANQRAIPVDDGCEHIIGDKLLGCATKEPECIQKTLVYTCLALAVGELQIQHPAVALDDSHTIELSTDRTVA